MKTVLMVIGGIVVVFVVICIGLVAVASFSGTASTSRTPVVTKATPGTTSGDEAPAAQETTIGNVGDRIELDGVALTLVKVERMDQVGKYQEAKDGKIFVVAEMLIENTGKDKADYNPFYFKVKDTDGFETEATINMDDNALKSGNLSKGSKATGTVVFEVNEDAKGLVMTYESFLASPIQFSLDK